MIKDQLIRLRPTTFKRLPFCQLTHLRRKTGRVRRVIGREPERVVLLEVEIEGYIGVVWDFELEAVKHKK